MDRSRVLAAGYGLAQTALENIVGRIAVSELARTTVVEHVGGDPVLIPNGVHVKTLASAPAFGGMRKPQQICFLGRFEEPRKGFSILLDAFRLIADEIPQATLVVAGPGDPDAMEIDLLMRDRITFLGRVSDSEKASMLASSEIYVAPNTGGESFGIVLLEAMACRTPVIASNLAAFNRVLDYGKAGVSFENENAEDLARALRELLSNDQRRQQLSDAGFARVQKFDWGRVAGDIINVYETVTAMSGPVEEDFRGQIIGRLAGDS
jgi:phosphatidylinositol alpha-mannosyltransferase